MSEIVCLKIFPARFEAELAQQILESHGIKSFVSVDDCGGATSPRAHRRRAVTGARR